MRIGAVTVGVTMLVLGATGTAAAQVETQQPDERTPAATPAPAPAAPAAQPAAAPQPPAEQPATITIEMPAERMQLAARLGVIGGGEVAPKHIGTGHMQAAPVVVADFDYVVHPFFTAGLFAQGTSAGYDFYSNGSRLNTSGSLTIVSLGASLKARVPLGEKLSAKAGIYAGWNIVSMSATFDGKDKSASGGGLNLGLTAELAYSVSRTVSISGQVGFLSQVTGGVTVDGESESNDLAFKPKPFVTVGPEIHF